MPKSLDAEEVMVPNITEKAKLGQINADTSNSFSTATVYLVKCKNCVFKVHYILNKINVSQEVKCTHDIIIPLC